MKSGFAVAVVAALFAITATAGRHPRAAALTAAYSYRQYLADFGKASPATAAAFEAREEVFRRRLKDILTHNARGDASYVKGLSRFTDWTDEERAAFGKARTPTHNAAEPPQPQRRHNARAMRAWGATEGSPTLPPFVDYRSFPGIRVMTDVKDQGFCGNCYAFSATEAIESHWALAAGENVIPLSVQQLTSCSTGNATIHTLNRNTGCQGGDATTAFQWVNTSYWGLTSEWVYPWTDYFGFGSNITDNSTLTSKCWNVTERIAAKLAGVPPSEAPPVPRVNVEHDVTQLPSNNQTAFMEALAFSGPIALGVCSLGWYDYESGVFRNGDGGYANYSGTGAYFMIDHATLMVGYGHEVVTYPNGTAADTGYWIVRNSWGVDWGEGGYIKLYRPFDPKDNPCSPKGVFTEIICGTSASIYSGSLPHVFANPPHPGQRF